MPLVFPNVVHITLLLSSSYFLWRVFRRLFVKSPLANIPGPPSASWLKGNFGQLMNANGWAFHQSLADDYGTVCKVYGMFQKEQLYVSDPLALHHIVVKDQYIYEESSEFIENNKLTFGIGLLSTLGDHHRKQRKMLNPVFSPKHMRDLVPIFYPITHQLRDVLAQEVKNGNTEVDMSTWLSRAALEYIGQGGMGYKFDSLDPSKTDKYHDTIKLFSPVFFKLSTLQQFVPYVIRIGSPWVRRKALEFWPHANIQKVLGIVDVMHEKAVEVYNEKKGALGKNDDVVIKQVGKGKDILSILLKANQDSSEEDRLPEEELLGQLNTFLFAGHDTTSSALSRILHQLSLNQEIQRKVRDEVTAARTEHGDLDYDDLMNLPWLDAVCRETLRVYPPASQINRTTRKDVVLPLKWPIKSIDGKTEIREIPLRKNTDVVISIINANRSKEIWGEDAGEWKPERWLGKTPDEVARARLPGVYSSMMMFLGGGRACIGFKFSEVEMKIVLSILLESFIFSPCSKEIAWNMIGLASPTVKGLIQDRPVLPMKLTPVSNECEIVRGRD